MDLFHLGQQYNASCDRSSLNNWVCLINLMLYAHTHGQLFTLISIMRDLNLPWLQTLSEPAVKSARLRQPYRDTKDSQHSHKVTNPDSFAFSPFHAVAMSLGPKTAEWHI